MTVETPAGGLWSKLKRGLGLTHRRLDEGIEEAVAAEEGGGFSAESLEHLEEALLAADLGVATTMELVERVENDLRKDEKADPLRLRTAMLDEISVLLLDAPPPRIPEGQPRLTLMVGVNGVGKTTSMAKLAWRSLQRGETVLFAAADTFRAAAIEQLQVWGERLGVEIIAQQHGSDPAAVVFDALQAARARSIDHLIVDTAGRLHTKGQLMQELAKIGRVVEREGQDRARCNLLVVDGTTGQNAIAQAKEFKEALRLDGVFLTKLDGTAKGGIVVALARELRLPVAYLGVGEGPEDIVDFRPRDFARALLG